MKSLSPASLKALYIAGIVGALVVGLMVAELVHPGSTQVVQDATDTAVGRTVAIIASVSVLIPPVLALLTTSKDTVAAIAEDVQKVRTASGYGDDNHRDAEITQWHGTAVESSSDGPSDR